MTESSEECLARAAACRAAAASEALENVRQVHLEAAASWEMLAGRAQWVNPGEQPSHYSLGIADGALALPCTSNKPIGFSPFRAEPLGTEVPAETPTAESAFAATSESDDGGELASPEAETNAAADLQEIACKVMLYTNDGHMRTLREIEADVINLAIEIYHGRMAEVARRLGIGRSTLYRKLNELGIAVTA